MTPQERIDQIGTTLEALRPAWPHLLFILQERADSLMLELVAQNDEQKRGRIKALRELMELPQTLQQEREGIEAGLAG